jgi:hypothetical protein
MGGGAAAGSTLLCGKEVDGGRRLQNGYLRIEVSRVVDSPCLGQHPTQ